jgi:transcriptional regulator with XRE-family HTH domain
MKIVDKLKTLREYYGYSQNELAKILNTPQRNISNYETTQEPSGVLEYIINFCKLFNIPIAEFFMENIEDLKKDLPDYITPQDAAILKILNTSVDIRVKVQVKKAYVDIMKAILIQYADKLKHMPEYKTLFETTTYDPPEEEIYGLNKVAEGKEEKK